MARYVFILIASIAVVASIITIYADKIVNM
jgi:hypothetical protein